LSEDGLGGSRERTGSHLFITQSPLAVVRKSQQSLSLDFLTPIGAPGSAAAVALEHQFAIEQQ
jgi:hypothetical protein